MAAAFFIYPMNETRVTAVIYIMHREMSYSQFNEILLCRDYLLSVFISLSDLSSSFTHMLGLENLNLMCAVVSRTISRYLLAHTQRFVLFLQQHINYFHVGTDTNVENPQLFPFIMHSGT